MRGLDVGEHGRPEKEPVPCDLPLQYQTSLAFSDLDVAAHVGSGSLVDQGAHAVARIFRRPYPEAHDRLGEPLEEHVRDRFMHDRP